MSGFSIFYRFNPAVVSKAFIALLLSTLVLGFTGFAWAEKSSPVSDHNLFVDQDGKLWGWGDNSSGQLGREGLPVARLPLLVDIATPVLSASAGRRHSVAVDNLGSVWVWGDNSAGQLGTGDFKNLSHPLRLELPSMIAVAAGAWHTVALDNTGHVWAWGGNTLGQLGNGKSGKFSVSTTPKKVDGIDNVVAIRSGDYHVLALRADGSVWAWGGNQQGQLGDGKRIPHDRPSQVAGLAKIRLISGGGNVSEAVGVDGKAWAWGYHSSTDEGWLTPHQLESALPDEGSAAYSISGRVIASDHPVAEATVSIDAEVCGKTDRHGSYHCLLPAGFEGVLRAQKDGFIFDSAKFHSISKPLTGQNIMGNVGRALARHVGLKPDLQSIDVVGIAPTNEQSGLKKNGESTVSAPAAPIPVDSSERIREKELAMLPVVAAPEFRSKATENAAVPVKEEPQAATLHIAGTVHLGAKGQPVSSVEIAGKGAQCGKTDARGEYLCSVPSGWSGHLVAAKRNYKFSPNSISFRDVREDRPYQDFTAVYEPD